MVPPRSISWRGEMHCPHRSLLQTGQPFAWGNKVKKGSIWSIAENSVAANSQLSYSLQLLLLMDVCKVTFLKRGNPSRKEKKKSILNLFPFFPINSFICGWIWNVRNKQRFVDPSAWWPSKGIYSRNLSTKFRGHIPKPRSEFWGFV